MVKISFAESTVVFGFEGTAAVVVLIKAQFAMLVLLDPDQRLFWCQGVKLRALIQLMFFSAVPAPYGLFAFLLLKKHGSTCVLHLQNAGPIEGW